MGHGWHIILVGPDCHVVLVGLDYYLVIAGSGCHMVHLEPGGCHNTMVLLGVMVVARIGAWPLCVLSSLGYCGIRFSHGCGVYWWLFNSIEYWLVHGYCGY